MNELNQKLRTNFHRQRTLHTSLAKQAARSLASQIEKFVHDEKMSYDQSMQNPPRIWHHQDDIIFVGKLAQMYNERYSAIAYSVLEAVEEAANLEDDPDRVKRFSVGQGEGDDSFNKIQRVITTLKELAEQINTPDFIWNV